MSQPTTPPFTPPAIRFFNLPETGGAPTAVVVGAPLDLTESFRAGAAGGPATVRAVSDALEGYSPVLDRDLVEDGCLLDLGDLALDGLPMDAALAAIAEGMRHAASMAGLAVMLGGEHTASLGGFRGIKRVYPQARLLQVDAHLDMRADYAGERYTHATWLHRAGEEFGFELIHQVGLRSGERAEWRFARERTAYSSTDLALPPDVRRGLAGKPLYVSIDIDVLDPAHAPGTGCPEPGGVTFRELAALLYSLEGLHVVGLDVMEVSPSTDPAAITALAAAKLVREAILLFGRNAAS
jgi:agmatinase